MKPLIAIAAIAAAATPILAMALTPLPAPIVGTETHPIMLKRMIVSAPALPAE